MNEEPKRCLCLCVSWYCEGLQVIKKTKRMFQIQGGLCVNVEATTTIFGFWEINADPNQNSFNYKSLKCCFDVGHNFKLVKRCLDQSA